MSGHPIDYGRMAELLTAETGRQVEPDSIVDALFLLVAAEERGVLLGVADELGRLSMPKISEATRAKGRIGLPNAPLRQFAAGVLRVATLPPQTIMHACYRWICSDLFDQRVKDEGESDPLGTPRRMPRCSWVL